MTNEELYSLLLNHPNAYSLCTKFINKYNNNMNVNFDSNGEKNLLEHLSKYKHLNTFFDVGSNVGHYSNNIFSFFPNSDIHCFDPIEENFLKLKSLIKKKTNCVISAVSDKDGMVEFYVDKEDINSGHNSIYDMNEIGYIKKTNKISVQQLTLDKYIKDKDISFVDFIKIDVEGNELKVLKGLEESLKNKKVGFIQFEFGHAARASRNLFIDFVRFFKTYNFDIYTIFPTGIKKINYTPFFENIYDVGNFLAFKSNSNELSTYIIK